MYSDIEERASMLARYIIDNQSTVRVAARVFSISKSTVHKDISERLERTNPILASEAKKVLEYNKEQRHIRGGMATKMKYKNRKKLELKNA